MTNTYITSSRNGMNHSEYVIPFHRVPKFKSKCDDINGRYEHRYCLSFHASKMFEKLYPSFKYTKKRDYAPIYQPKFNASFQCSKTLDASNSAAPFLNFLKHFEIYSTQQKISVKICLFSC